MKGHLRAAPDPGRPASSSRLPIRVVLADEHAGMLDGVGNVLASEPDIEVVSATSDLAGALRAVALHRPDVVAADLRAADGSSVVPIGRLHQAAPRTGIVAMSMVLSAGFVADGLRAGATGFVLKGHADEELADAIRAVARGHSYVSLRLDGR